MAVKPDPSIETISHGRAAAHAERQVPEPAPMKRRWFHAQLVGLLGWLAASFAAGSVGALASANANDFYGQLSRPAWAPPAGLFGPVWSVLYLLMAVAAWLVWRKFGFRDATVALLLFVLQLVANILTFWRLQRLAALLLLPYLAWVSFASALTFSLWRMNPTVLG